MFIQEVFVSETNARELANTVAAFLRGEHEGSHFRLVVANKDHSERCELWIRPSFSANLNPVTAAEQIMCETEDGREVHLIIPSLDRDKSFALVLLGEKKQSGDCNTP